MCLVATTRDNNFGKYEGYNNLKIIVININLSTFYHL